MSDWFTRRRLMIAAIALALLAWLLWPDRNLAKVRALQAELQGDAVAGLSQEERQEKFRQLRTAMEKLSPAQRQLLSADGQQRMQDQMAKYFTMTPAEKKAHLDQEIDRMEDRRKRMEANKGANAKTGAPANAPPNGAFKGGPRGDKGPASPEDREKRRQQRLDHTSPEFRGQMDQYRKDMQDRRKQRGLPSMPPGRGR